METKGKTLKGIEIVDEPSQSREDPIDLFRSSPVCGNCIRFLTFNLLGSAIKPEKRCSVFTDGIPEEIWSGIHDHTTHFKGDKGIRYKAPENKDIIILLEHYIKENGVKKDLASSLLEALKT
jgi:hypothetical protein